ncbi:exonuclease domain-containing protein [Sphingosinicella sp. BN140058]|uniref:exonuclease domain-containing protein n=1 Tax=Sphingosinicella sp. BN140058 TaxID=1892855 RepID=UPI001012D931|nr:exonuclease domain-containing protein [Sphingosinicella sp. BN140058]QAY80156.1 DNA polymerase III subunit epsilon [Sphingosinicella sp. BN140058]
MPRLYAYDSETTGLHVVDGDRIIEVALVEITRSPNPRSFHSYVNPDGRQVHPEALAVHGITDEMVADAPTFEDVLEQMLDFIGDDEPEIIIHNAAFDVPFLETGCAEINRAWPDFKIIDTLKLAARHFPGRRHSLDALCGHFRIDLTSRTKHGALVDASLLAQVYLAWFGQGGLDLTAQSVTQVAEDISNLGALNTVLVNNPNGLVSTFPAWAPFLAPAAA